MAWTATVVKVDQIDALTKAYTIHFAAGDGRTLDWAAGSPDTRAISTDESPVTARIQAQLRTLNTIDQQAAAPTLTVGATIALQTNAQKATALYAQAMTIYQVFAGALAAGIIAADDADLATAKSNLTRAFSLMRQVQQAQSAQTGAILTAAGV